MFSDSSFSIFYYCTIVEFLYTWSQTKLSRPMPSTQHNINFVPYHGKLLMRHLVVVAALKAAEPHSALFQKVGHC
jgi:hypothetical protein